MLSNISSCLDVLSHSFISTAEIYVCVKYGFILQYFIVDKYNTKIGKSKKKSKQKKMGKKLVKLHW